MITFKAIDETIVDESNYIHWINDHHTVQYLENVFPPVSKADLRGFIKQCNDNENIDLLGIFKEQIHIGIIKLNAHPYHLFGDVGLVIDAPYQGQGVGKKALGEMIQRAREKKMHKLIAGAYATNKASIGLFTSCGFELIATFKRHYKGDNGYIDKVMMEYFL